MKNNKTFNNYMKIALNISKRNKKTINDEVPVGCVIVDNKTGTILAKSCNRTKKTNNPIQHAEIVCINKALKKIKKDRLTNCSMYITLEPCLMCTGAIILSKIKKIYIGCLSKKTGYMISNGGCLDNNKNNHKPEIFYPIMEKDCKKIIVDFFKKKRIN